MGTSSLDVTTPESQPLINKPPHIACSKNLFAETDVCTTVIFRVMASSLDDDLANRGLQILMFKRGFYINFS